MNFCASTARVNYPYCDVEVEKLAKQIWGTFEIPEEEKEIQYGKGKIYWGGNYTKMDDNELFPNYSCTAELLRNLGVKEDFKASGSIRYIHRVDNNRDIYFISNRTDSPVKDICTFRTVSGVPELWNPLTGEARILTNFTVKNGQTLIPIELDKSQSFFIVFGGVKKAAKPMDSSKSNFPKMIGKGKISGSWNVSFNPKWGGPENITFDKLSDWSTHSNEGIRYYSGMATYFKTFDMPGTIKSDRNSEIFLDLGDVKNVARVSLNGKDLGVVWTSPWRVNITDVVKDKGNKMEIKVANLWGNRLIGDEKSHDDGIKNGKWPDWLLEDKPRTSGRFTFTTLNFYEKNSPLQSSGLLGPVQIVKMNK